MVWLYQISKFQENRSGRNPTNWLQSWSDVLHLEDMGSQREGVPTSFPNHSQRRHPYILRRLTLQVVIQSAATRCASREQRRLHYRARTQHFAHLAKRGLHADRTAGGRRGQSTGTIRIYLYSSWLKYCNDALLQNLPSIVHNPYWAQGFFHSWRRRSLIGSFLPYPG